MWTKWSSDTVIGGIPLAEVCKMPYITRIIGSGSESFVVSQEDVVLYYVIFEAWA